ncbi:hypothetical protein D3C71_1051830 [compost metagenome]
MRVAAPTVHAMASRALQDVVGAHGLPQAVGRGRIVRRRLRRNQQQDYNPRDPGNPGPPTSRHLPFATWPHGLAGALSWGLAKPTITDVVQWKIEDSLDMHQFTSLCRNI